MPRKCSVCNHQNRAAIDSALLSGASIASIARDNAGLSERAIGRHQDGHIPQALAKAQSAAEVARGDTLLDQVRDLQAKALAILAKAEKSNDLRAANGAIREARGCLELQGKLVGELDRPAINILVSAEWHQVRAVLVSALTPYPEVGAVVAAALARCGDVG